MDTLDLIKVKLIESGHGGLYYPGECSCEVADLAPCGEAILYEGEDYINGCSAGFKFEDSQNPGFWIIKWLNVEPSPEDWETFRLHWL